MADFSLDVSSNQVVIFIPIYYSHVCLCGHLYVGTVIRDVRSLGLEVTGSCELPALDAVSILRSFVRAVQALNC